MSHPNQKGTKVSNAHRTPLSRLRAALGGRRAEGSDAFAGTGAPSEPGSGARSHRAKLGLATALAGVLGLVLFAALAGASIKHQFKETFGSAAQPTFTTPHEVAVDQSNGDLLVMDAGSPPSIKRYKPDGTADNFSALGTNVIDGKKGPGGLACASEPASCDETPQNGLSFPSTSEGEIAIAPTGSAGGTAGDIYVTTRSPKAITIFKPTGEYAGQLTQYKSGPTAGGSLTGFSEACGVAVDPSGAVYVGDYSGESIHKYVPAANPPVNGDSSANFSSVGEVCPIAAGAGPTAGSLFPAKWNGAIYKINSSTGVVAYNFSSSTTTLSVDPTSGYVYAAKGSEVKEYNASGSSATLVSSIAPGSSVEGVAVRGSSEEVFLDRSGQSHVEVYGSAVNVPEYPLAVGKSGSGSGTVTSSPPGINCGSTCTAEFEESTAVTLTAAPATGSTFAGWNGSGCSGTGTCTVTMSAAHNVTAAFLGNERPFLFAFDGHDSAVGSFLAPEHIAIDNATGDVYVADGEAYSYAFGEWRGRRAVSKFNPDGTAATIPATGSSTLLSPANGTGVAVDNSGGAGQGDVLTNVASGGAKSAFDPSGHLLWQFGSGYGDVAVDATGHPWFRNTQYASTGSPPAPTGCELSGGNEAIDFDSAGNAYVVRPSESLVKYTKTGACAFTQSTLAAGVKDVYADQSSPSGHVFAIQANDFAEYDQSGSPLGTYGAPYVQAGYHSSIAYNPSSGRVYVSERLESDPHPVIAVFGPPVSGATPAVTETHAALTGTEVSTAHLSGKVNPENVASTAHFEWKTAHQTWAEAALRQSSAPQTLTTNNSEQSVAADTDALRGNTTYEVRLVGVNSANKLVGISAAPVTITTKKASEAPVVTTAPVTTFTTTTATVQGTVNPKGDTADWRLEVEKGCSGGFTAEPLESLAHSSTTPQSVTWSLTGLTPSERYCVRFSATNSYGTTHSIPQEFTTAPIPPDEAETLPAAPRTDTSARLNARVNPEGEVLTYRFEWSADGSTWHALPDQTYSGEDRAQIVVGEELENLTPATTYSYRFSAENPAPSSVVQGGEHTFTTRTSAEIEAASPPPGSCPNEAVRSAQRSTYLGDCRGIEMVNSPEKGNQELFLVPEDMSSSPYGATSPDGERALWYVTGGSPGGNVSGDYYLSRRTASGWTSKTLIPPPAEQLRSGANQLLYGLLRATPSLSRFAFLAEIYDIGSPIPPTTLRLDDAQHQEVLGEIGHGLGATYFNQDGSHTLGFYLEAGKYFLEELGPGGRTERLDIMPDGTPSSCGEGTAYERLQQYRPGYSFFATTDASRAYFEAAPNSACGGVHGLYERNREAGTTTLIDPGASGRGQEGWPELIRTTPDGRQAYFLTVDACRKWTQTAPFTCEAPEPADTNTDADVYRFDEASGESTCLTCVVPDAKLATTVARPFEQVLVSNDFSHIYFVSHKQLVAGAVKGGGIYVLSGGTLRFVAPFGSSAGLTNGVGRISADGNVLVFVNGGTAGVNGGTRIFTADEIAPGEARSEQLYRYDDRDQSLECLSCRHGGLTTHRISHGAGGQMNGDWGLSADGQIVVFYTAEALLPQDVNNRGDLYEWRNGVLHLLSDGITEFGESGNAPQLAAIDPSGNNIFFAVQKPGLTGFEADGYNNLYDARVGGGFEPPNPPAHCSEESCQGPLQAAPALPVGGANFHGAGNLHPKLSCRKGSVRRHGRCVKQRHRRKHAGRHVRHARAKQGRSK